MQIYVNCYYNVLEIVVYNLSTTHNNSDTLYRRILCKTGKSYTARTPHYNNGYDQTRFPSNL